MERAIETVATGMGSAITFAAERGILFAVFGLLWLAFGVGLVLSQGSLDAAWEWVRSLPLILQGVLWLLFLPVMVGLWVWEMSWPVAIRLLVVIGLAGWTLLIFLPKAAART